MKILKLPDIAPFRAGGKYLIVICGPTAIGKTSLAIDIAKEFGTEIISADSRQFFREMNIGTAKPIEEELEQVKHHFINSLSIKDEYNVGEFEKDALKVLEKIFSKKKTAVMVGGSGLYINAVCNGFDNVPSSDKEVRANIMEMYKREGIEYLRTTLKKLDKEHYSKVDLSNPHRMIRAIEVCIVTGKKYSELRKSEKKPPTPVRTKLRTPSFCGEGEFNPIHRKRDFTIIKIGLNMEREKLYERINMRVDEMMKAGLLEEAKALAPFRAGGELNALNTVGYKELFDFLDGNHDLARAVELIKQNTRNFAKRQLTWFRKDKEVNWFQQDEKEKIIEFLKNKID